MDFWKFFKGFLGHSKHNEAPNNSRDDRYTYLKDDNSIVRSHPSEQEEEFGFNIFSNPLDMHRYFEKQMNDVFNAFGFQDENFAFRGPQHYSFFDSDGFQEGVLHDGASVSSQVPPNGNLRDHYLKPGYAHQQYNDSNKADSDVDGKVDMNDVDTVFNNKNSQLSPHKGQPRFHLFGQSITSKTLRNADGSIETHRTVKDHEGNKETTITRKVGDKEHTIITKTTKDGKKEIMENFTNCDEGDSLEAPDGRRHSNWFPFDKYFK